VRWRAQSHAPPLFCESKRGSPVLAEQVSLSIDLAASTGAIYSSPSSNEQPRDDRDGGGSQLTRFAASGHLDTNPTPGWQMMTTRHRPDSTQI
jgi:hypothetical protein